MHATFHMMLALKAAGLVFVFVAASCGAAQQRTADATPPPATQPAKQEPPADRPAATQPSDQPSSGNTAASQPSSARATADPEVERLLDKLEAAGRDRRGITCRVEHSLVIVDPVEERKRKFGDLVFYRDEKKTRFRIHFNKLEAAGVISRDQEFYAFDGEYFIERNDKSRTVRKTQIVRQGEEKDPFALGQGPFPLPFGQKRDEILKHFTINLVKFEIGDPPGSKHLHCVPRPGTELARKYARVEFYIDPDLHLPVRVVCERLSDGDRIEVDFRDVVTTGEIDAKRFEVPRPSDFTLTVEPLSEGGVPELMP